MYKCSECEKEYDIMPKYCDCGNDIFINVDDIPLQEIDDIDEEDFQTESRVRPDFRAKSFSPLALTLFILCVILSVLILFIPVKQGKTNISIKNDTKENIEIPLIDTFWDNTPVKISKNEESLRNNILDIMPEIIQEILPPEKTEIKADVTVKKTPVTTQKGVQENRIKPLASQTPVKVSAGQNTNKKAADKIQTKKQTQSQAAPQQVMTFEDLTNKIRYQYNTPQSTTNTSSTNSKNQSQITSSNKPTQPTQVKTSQTVSNSQAKDYSSVQNTKQVQAQNQLSQTITPNPGPVEQAKSTAQLKQELAVYKSGLRNTIGKRINFTRVIGDGECSLSFKINSAGRLTSKAFITQSSNITLNDAVFNALNTTTSYNPPPEGYNGETLRLNIKFYNGNFEISLN